MEDTMTIGKLARTVRVNPRTLRYYERIGLLTPSGRTQAGYRIYTQRDASRLVFIRCAQSTGLSLSEIADIISIYDAGTPPCRHVRALAELKVAEIDARIAELRALQEKLTRLAERAYAVETTCGKDSHICLAFDREAQTSP